jgi:hypothetical protein
MALWCFRFLSGLALIVAMLSSSGGTSAQQFQNADLFSAWIFRTCAVHDDGKLEAALAQTGTQLVPAFVQAAQNGPDSSRLTQLHAKAAQQYDDIAAFLAGGDGPSLGLSSGDIQALQNVTRDDFIVEEVGNAVFNYQARALEGLGIVGGPVALQVLQSFANNTGSPLQPVAQQALANFAGPTTMAANITSKSGPSSARLWTVTFMNNGPAAAMGVQVNSVNLTQNLWCCLQATRNHPSGVSAQRREHRASWLWIYSNHDQLHGLPRERKVYGKYLVLGKFRNSDGHGDSLQPI